MNDDKRASASSQLLVAPKKSSRLTAMLNKSMGYKTLSDSKNKQSHVKSVSDLKPELKIVLDQAIELIEEDLNTILNNYPNGKQNTLFKLKYGIEANQVREMPMKDAFSLLHLDPSKIRNFHLIKNLDCYGKITASLK